jgi:hypothetical protein
MLCLRRDQGFQSERASATSLRSVAILQKVTQGGEHAPPRGYIARTIRSAEAPDPNVGRLDSDRQEQKRDKLWKVYEPRWPKSADGKWFWKSDTSSDETGRTLFLLSTLFRPVRRNRTRERAGPGR